MSPSPDGTTVVSAIVDASGDVWTITTHGQVAVNGAIDYRTAGVVRLAYSGGSVFQQNAGGGWWYMARHSGQWVASAAPPDVGGLADLLHSAVEALQAIAGALVAQSGAAGQLAALSAQIEDNARHLKQAVDSAG